MTPPTCLWFAARAYLDQMQAGLEDGSGRRGVTGGVSDEDEGSSGDDEGRDMIAKRLREEAAEVGRRMCMTAGCDYRYRLPLHIAFESRGFGSDDFPLRT